MIRTNWLLKISADQDQIELAHGSKISEHRDEQFQYSDEAKLAREAIARALKRRKAVAPERPGWDATPEQKAAFNEAAKEWNTLLETIGRPIQTKAERAFAKRLAAKTPAERRYAVGNGNPVMGRNLARRLRTMAPADARRLNQLERRIMALQLERKHLIWWAWARAGTLTPDQIADLASERSRKANDKEPGRDYQRTQMLDAEDFVFEPKDKAAAA